MVAGFVGEGLSNGRWEVGLAAASVSMDGRFGVAGVGFTGATGGAEGGGGRGEGAGLGRGERGVAFGIGAPTGAAFGIF